MKSLADIIRLIEAAGCFAEITVLSAGRYKDRLYMVRATNGHGYVEDGHVYVSVFHPQIHQHDFDVLEKVMRAEAKDNPLALDHMKAA